MKNSMGTRQGWLSGPIVLLALVAARQPASAGEGDLDPSFGNGGVEITDFSGADDYAMGVVLQTDGRIVVVGRSGSSTFHSVVVRYASSGIPDDEFGDHGRVLADFSALGDQLNAVGLQDDGRIVAVGSVVAGSRPVFLVARFLADGSLDPSFGSLGAVATGFGDLTASANAVLVQPDGRIVAVGVSGAGAYSELNDFALARYFPDGSLDTSFGNGGKVVTHFPGVDNTGSRANGVALQPDGQLLVSGAYKNEGTPRRLALARYHTDGTLDATFGNQGRTTTTLGTGEALPGGIVVQSDGRIVLSGSSTTGRRNHDFALVRYDANGALDSGFGDGGRVIHDLFGTSDDIGYALALQRDGKLIVSGRTGDYPNFEFGLARFLTDGELDPSFGDGGRVRTSLGGFSNQVFASALRPDGRIVVAGYTITSSSDLVVARYLASTIPHVLRR